MVVIFTDYQRIVTSYNEYIDSTEGLINFVVVDTVPDYVRATPKGKRVRVTIANDLVLEDDPTYVPPAPSRTEILTQQVAELTERVARLEAERQGGE
ncbi:hypothetical protein D3C76_334230 [compost metagenome]